jgi:hypothetical protein
MRILEECTPTWPMLEMRVQIDTLREAFSADTSKPFELKANFPLGSPTPQPETTPTANTVYSTTTAQDLSHLAEGQVNYNMVQPITPPISTSEDDRNSHSPVAQQSRRLMSSQDGTHGTPNVMQSQGNVHAHWNPIPLFESVPCLGL